MVTTVHTTALQHGRPRAPVWTVAFLRTLLAHARGCRPSYHYHYPASDLHHTVVWTPPRGVPLHAGVGELAFFGGRIAPQHSVGGDDPSLPADADDYTPSPYLPRLIPATLIGLFTERLPLPTRTVELFTLDDGTLDTVRAPFRVDLHTTTRMREPVLVPSPAHGRTHHGRTWFLYLPRTLPHYQISADTHHVAGRYGAPENPLLPRAADE